MASLRRWFALSFLLPGLVLAAACASLDDSVYHATGFAERGTPYGQVLERYTRRAELYDEFSTVAKGWATWKSPELRRALAAASVDAYELGGQGAKAVLAEEERVARRVREFHLALYTPKKDWNDLEVPDSLWRAWLDLPDGTRLQPIQIVRLAKSDRSPVEFPYVTRWTQEYALFFPLLESEERHARLTLVLGGPLGTMAFRF
jgi:hypothetical protein